MLAIVPLLARLVLSGDPAPAAESAPVEESPLSRYPESAQQVFVNLGFSHWYGGTFGAPIGASTPALIVGVRPWTRKLEVRLHYTVAAQGVTLPTNGKRSNVGFANLDVLLSHELRVGGQRMVMGFGPSVGFVHTRQGVGLAVGADLSARYMIDIGEVMALGPFFDVRAQLYNLPGSDVPMYEVKDGRLEPGHSDSQLQIGVAVSLW
jgi:hypothetical protein